MEVFCTRTALSIRYKPSHRYGRYIIVIIMTLTLTLIHPASHDPHVLRTAATTRTVTETFCTRMALSIHCKPFHRYGRYIIVIIMTLTLTLILPTSHDPPSVPDSGYYAYSNGDILYSHGIVDTLQAVSQVWAVHNSN